MKRNIAEARRIAEVQRIARAERMLSEQAGRTLVKLVGDVGDACNLTIERMLVSVNPDGAAGPEPRTHFVITDAQFNSHAVAKIPFAAAYIGAENAHHKAKRLIR